MVPLPVALHCGRNKYQDRGEGGGGGRGGGGGGGGEGGRRERGEKEGGEEGGREGEEERIGKEEKRREFMELIRKKNIEERMNDDEMEEKVKRIVGGVESEGGEWPWLVSLQLRINRLVVWHVVAWCGRVWHSVAGCGMV